MCEKCEIGTRLLNSECVRCYEYEYSTDDRSDCMLNELYVMYAFVFQLWLAVVILPAGFKLQRRLYIFGVKHDRETGGFILQLCNKHGIHVSSSRSAKSYPRIYLYSTGHEALDHPGDAIHFKVFSDDQLQLLWIPKTPGSVCEARGPGETFQEPWNEKDKGPVMHLTEFSKISGFVRFGFFWELLHITMCRVPLFMWLAPPLACTVGVLVLWRIESWKNGNGALVGILLSVFGIVFWVLFLLGTRCVWQRAATHKQHKRHQLLNERALIDRLELACWERDQQREHEASG